MSSLDISFLLLECQTNSKAEVVETVLGIGHYIVLVGGVVVVYGHVKTNIVWPGVVVETNLGREDKSPPVLSLHEYIIIVIELRVACTQFQSNVWLEIALYETVAYKNTKG